jgi:hypothetical protein
VNFLQTATERLSMIFFEALVCLSENYRGDEITLLSRKLNPSSHLVTQECYSDHQVFLHKSDPGVALRASVIYSKINKHHDITALIWCMCSGKMNRYGRKFF